jgi:hypothetical protein
MSTCPSATPHAHHGAGWLHPDGHYSCSACGAEWGEDAPITFMFLDRGFYRCEYQPRRVAITEYEWPVAPTLRLVETT